MKDDSTTTTGKDASALSRRHLLTAGTAAGVTALTVGSVPAAAATPVPPVDTSFKDFVLSNIGCDDSLAKMQAKGEVVVGTSDDWPYSFYPAGSKEWSGLDADIINYVAKMLKIPKVTVQTAEFSGLIPGLLDGRFNIVGDSIHWTLARSKVVEFCFPTYYYSEWLAVKKGNPLKIHGFGDMKGKKIATLNGTNYAEWLRGVEGIDLQVVKNWQEVIQDLALGRVDGIIYDQPVLAASFKDHPEWPVELVEDYEPRTFKNPVGYSRYAFRQSDVQWCNAFSSCLEWMQDQGEMKKILTKWNLTGYNN
ncbi:MAG TPA: transporter substrate-binding domain-containing protein [Stellaceae bacterium]|nr:transporter substrate-binding domain-containing protein [Stellaceae bacterium]